MRRRSFGGNGDDHADLSSCIALNQDRVVCPTAATQLLWSAAGQAYGVEQNSADLVLLADWCVDTSHAIQRRAPWRS